MLHMKPITPYLFLAGLLFAGAAVADERILAYDSSITVHADATMDVVETIRVRAEGQNIRRGIYRDFPTDYEDRFGNDYRVNFEVVAVRRDDAPESYHTERLSNGVRVYVGSSQRYLTAGEYTYTIHFRTNRQLGYFDGHDELYWNVTGHGWIFPIDSASAIVSLPKSVAPEDIAIEGYTGRTGSSEQSYDTEVTGDGTVRIWTTRRLNAYEGLTLVVAWPKGEVLEPTLGDRAIYLVLDNRGLLTALAGLALVLVYLLYVWNRVGRDPEPGAIFPHYVPPPGYSPASIRYISEMGYDQRTLTAAILNLAVKGFIEIDNTGDDYILICERPPPDERALAPGEEILLRQLFIEDNVLVLDNENHTILLTAMSAHGKALKRDYAKRYFFTNTPLLIPSALITALLLGLVAAFSGLTISIAAVFALMLILHIVFYRLLKAPTKAGRRLLDKIEGFRSYIEIAEKDELNLRNPPDKTPELFEQYLPYALALGVEQDWAEKFADVLASIRDPHGNSYHPRWYHGNFSPTRISSFTSDVGSSFHSAIASASTAPGSSSGGGGGGFSGGGGGGGGGGGW